MATQYIEDPQTKQRIPFEWNKDTPPTSDDISALYDAVRTQPQPQAPPQTSKWKEMGGLEADSYKRSERIINAFEPKQGGESVGESVRQAPFRAATAVKEGAGFGLDVIKRGGQAIGRMIPGEERRTEQKAEIAQKKEKETPELIKTLQSSLGKVGVSAYQKGKDYFALFKRSYPTVATSIEAAVNAGLLFGGLGLGGKIAEPVVGAVKETGESIVKGMAKGGAEKVVTQTTGIPKTIVSDITTSLQKAGIRPKGVTEAPQIAKFYDSAATATIDIAKNKGKLGVLDKEGDLIIGHPKTADEYAQAFNKGKDKVWAEKIQPILDKTGEPSVSTTNIVKDLEVIINPNGKYFNALERQSPETIPYIKKLIESYKKQGFINFSQIEPELQMVNASLKALKTNPSIGTAANAYAALRVAKWLRAAEDSVVQGVTGEGVAEAKKLWGAYAQIEKSIAQKAAQMQGKSGFGYWDMASIAEGMAGIASFEPHLLIAAAGTKGVATLVKRSRDADRIIEKMFKRIDKSLPRAGLNQKGYIDPKAAFATGAAAGGGTAAYKYYNSEENKKARAEAAKKREIPE
jgi:hypothetical protein